MVQREIESWNPIVEVVEVATYRYGMVKQLAIARPKHGSAIASMLAVLSGDNKGTDGDMWYCLFYYTRHQRVTGSETWGHVWLNGAAHVVFSLQPCMLKKWWKHFLTCNSVLLIKGSFDQWVVNDTC